MQNGMSMRDEPVGNQHAMALEPHTLRTHISRARMLGLAQQSLDRLLELICQHVIGIVPETRVPQGNVRRIRSRLLPISSKPFHPHVANPRCRHRLLQRLSIEMRQTSRSRKSPDVNQHPDRMRAQHTNKLFKRAGRMSDGVKGRQNVSVMEGLRKLATTRYAG